MFDAMLNRTIVVENFVCETKNGFVWQTTCRTSTPRGTNKYNMHWILGVILRGHPLTNFVFYTILFIFVFGSAVNCLRSNSDQYLANESLPQFCSVSKDVRAVLILQQVGLFLLSLLDLFLYYRNERIRASPSADPGTHQFNCYDFFVKCWFAQAFMYWMFNFIFTSFLYSEEITGIVEFTAWKIWFTIQTALILQTGIRNCWYLQYISRSNNNNRGLFADGPPNAPLLSNRRLLAIAHTTTTREQTHQQPHEIECSICLDGSPEQTTHRELAVTNRYPQEQEQDQNDVEEHNFTLKRTASFQLVQCEHEFHQACLKQWLSTGANTCPLCRRRCIVTSEEKEYDSEQAIAF